MIDRGVSNFHASKLYIKMYNLVNNHEYTFIDSKNVIWCIHTDLTLKHRETHGCVVSTVVTDALVLKHRAISILSTD